MLLNDKIFKIDLQMHAEDTNDNAGEDPNSVDKQATGEEGGEDKQEKTFTQEELDSIIKDRLSRERKKQEEELRRQIEEERKEAKRLADLTAEERAKEIAKKNAEENESLKQQLRRLQLEQDAIKRLEEDNIDLSFKDFLIGEDEETTNENIKKFKEVFEKTVEEAVKEKLVGQSPERTPTNLGGSSSIDTISEIAAASRII